MLAKAGGRRTKTDERSERRKTTAQEENELKTDKLTTQTTGRFTSPLLLGLESV